MLNKKQLDPEKLKAARTALEAEVKRLHKELDQASFPGWCTKASKKYQEAVSGIHYQLLISSIRLSVVEDLLAGKKSARKNWIGLSYTPPQPYLGAISPDWTERERNMANGSNIERRTELEDSGLSGTTTNL